jgi:hypothetical protein
VKGIAGDELPNEAVKNLRAMNAAFATPSDHGAVVPRIPCSAGGTSFHAGRDVDREFARLEALQRALDDPSSEDYCAVQRVLGTSEALHLSVVPEESNFGDSVLVRDDKSDRLIRLDYGDKTQAFHASWQ